MHITIFKLLILFCLLTVLFLTFSEIHALSYQNNNSNNSFIILVQESPRDTDKNDGSLKSTDIDEYFHPSFSYSEVGKKLKNTVRLNLIFIRSASFVKGDARLEPRSINISNFQQKKYLQFKFKSELVYNVLKLKKYDIGKKIFDSVIKEVLKPMTNIYAPKIFYGYDLIVIAHYRDFSNKYDYSKEIEFRFLIPQEMALKYINKEISEQKLLDSTIILMDDSRIELKLS